jgi:uncharacterized protein
VHSELAQSMNVTGEFTVQAPREEVFRVLQDANSFVRFVDGVYDLKEIDATHYEAAFETKIAYMKFRFAVTVEIVQLREPSEIEARIEGRPLGLIGRLSATSRTVLQDAGLETRVVYSVDSALTGKLGSIGQPVLRAKAKEMERQFSERLRAAFAPIAENAPEAR